MAERPHITSVEPLPAASVMVFRSAPSGPVVLYLRRNPELAFHGGDWVFPGGRIDAADRQLAESHDEATTARYAAVREADEEAGLELQIDGLVYAVHWTTPLAQPIRFGAWFFVAQTISDLVQIDGQEIHDYRWMRPADALTAHAAGTIQLAAPTFALTTRLAGFPDVQSVFTAVREWPDERLLCRLYDVTGGGGSRSTSRTLPTIAAGDHSTGQGPDTGCGCSTAGGATSEHSDRTQDTRPREPEALPLSYFDIALCSLTVLVGSTLQGSIGFGMGLFASPILILIDERFVPAPILLSTWVMTTFLILRERHAIDIRGLRWAVVGRAVGTVAAATVLALLPRDRMPLVFGVLVLIGVAMSLSGLRFRPSRSVLLGAGAMSAVMGTIASIGGPPMALVYQDAPGARLRATMSSFFWIGTVMSLVVLRFVGRFGEDEIRLTLVILPGALLGLLASRWTSAVVDRGYTRTVVLTLAAAAGLAVIVRQLVS